MVAKVKEVARKRIARSEQVRRFDVLARLKGEYPGSAKDLCELNFRNPFELLVATILSAQCTDARVNETTPKLFEKLGTPQLMAQAQPADVEGLIYSTGFYRNKAKNIVQMAQRLIIDHGGRVPQTMQELSNLPGVGRKTANVVLSVAYGLPGLPVDTHVGRLSRRLGFTSEKDAVRVESDLMQWVPESEAGGLSLRLIRHGRKVCRAQRPLCSACLLNDLCPYFGQA